MRRPSSGRGLFIRANPTLASGKGNRRGTRICLAAGDICLHCFRAGSRGGVTGRCSATGLSFVRWLSVTRLCPFHSSMRGPQPTDTHYAQILLWSELAGVRGMSAKRRGGVAKLRSQTAVQCCSRARYRTPANTTKEAQPKGKFEIKAMLTSHTDSDECDGSATQLGGALK